MKTFVVVASLFVLLAMAISAHRQKQAECESRICSGGKTARLMQAGRYTYECICVEVPR